MKKFITLVSATLLSTVASQAQDFLGLNTGNYAGITGVALQPASIADSRYKFDMNITSFSLDYNSNFIGISKDFAVKNKFNFGSFSNYNDFKTQILTYKPVAGENGYLNISNTIQAPISFMMSTGKKSAIALNIRSRSAVAMAGIPEGFEPILFNGFQNNATYQNQNINITGLNMQAVSWMDVGLTYARTLVDEDKHFLKAGITGKYIGGLSSLYMNAKDNVIVNQTGDSAINAAGSYVEYGHSASNFKVQPQNYSPDASSFAFDAGIVYEYRGRINKFKFLKLKTDGEVVERSRRDKNKYSFRVGASLVDVGKMTFKTTNLANDFTVNNSFPLYNPGINNVADFDNFISSRVNYVKSGTNAYTIALPTAYSVQLDVHLLRGFYINALSYQPLDVFNKTTTFRTYTPSYYAVTPRWESRLAGIYVPFTINKQNEIHAGATLRLGPIFVGSSNLGTLFNTNDIKAADLHAGLKLPIAYGKPSKFLNKFNKIKDNLSTSTNTNKVENNTNVDVNKTINSDTRVIETTKEIVKENRNIDANIPPVPQPIKIIINNYNGSGTTPSTQTIDVDGNNGSQIINTNTDQDLQQQINELKRKIDQKEKLLKELELKAKDKNSTGCIEIKKKIVSLNDSYAMQNNQNAIVPTGNSIFNFKQDIYNLDAKNKELNERINAAILSISKDIDSTKNNDNLLCKLYVKNELLNLKTDGNAGKTVMPSVQKNEKITLANTNTQPQNVYVQADTARNNIVLANEIKQLREELKNKTAQLPASNYATNNYNNIDTAKYINKQDYNKLLTEITALRSDIKNKKEVAPVNTTIIKRRRWFWQKADNNTTDNNYAQIAAELAALKASANKTTIVRDTILVEKIVEKPVDRIVEKIVEVPTTKIIRDTVSNNYYNTKTDTVVITKSEQLLSIPPDVILFDIGKAIIKANYFSRLNYYAKQLAKYKNINVTLTGHTDNSGDAAKNKILSENRATKVKKYLLSHGATEAQIVTAFDGADSPVSENNNASGKSQNRRVEIQFSK